MKGNSFGAFVDRGATPEEIQAHFCISAEEYERKLKNLKEIRERNSTKQQRRKHE